MMKTHRLFILGILASAAIASQAQEFTQPGWFRSVREPAGVVEQIQFVENSGEEGGTKTDGLASPPEVAEAITPEIQALARGLENDPKRIFDYVHDHIRYVHYFGSKKGAELTLLERSGNDFDQSALLVALLRAAGYTNADYQFGWMKVPYHNYDESHRDLQHWLQLSLVNTNFTYTSNYLTDLFYFIRGYP